MKIFLSRKSWKKSFNSDWNEEQEPLSYNSRPRNMQNAISSLSRFLRYSLLFLIHSVSSYFYSSVKIRN